MKTSAGNDAFIGTILESYTPSSVQMFSRIQAISIIGLLIGSLITFTALKLFPTTSIAAIFESKFSHLGLSVVRLDYDYYLASSNPESAARTWITEFVVSMLAVVSMFLQFFGLIFIQSKENSIHTQVSHCKVFSSAHLASVFLCIIMSLLLLIGFNQNLILGSYRFSTGPNDFPILFFVCMLTVLVATVYGCLSFILVITTRFSKYFKASLKNGK